MQTLRGAEVDNHQDRVIQQSNMDEIVADKQRLESQVAALKEDRVVLQEQLHEVSHRCQRSQASNLI